MPHISTHYSYTLVALSIAIVVIFFYIAIYLLNKFKTASDINRIALWGAALIAAFGIWSMHFVGMQAYQTPFVITYEFVRLIVSFTMIYATTIGLFTYANSDYQNIFLSALVSCLMGIGISAMHYIGMDSITIPATMAYDTDIVAFSVLYSCAISAVALYILRRLLHSSKDIPLLHLGYAALVLGAAASGMHYLGMSGTSWKPLAAANSNTRIVIDSELLTGLDIVTALLIFIAAAATLRYLSYNEIQKTRHALISIVLISLTIASLSICLIIYANNYVDRRNQLIDLVKQQANFLEAVANFDDQHSQSAHPKGAAYATLEQFVAGREKDDNISPITLSVLIVKSGQPFLYYGDEAGLLDEAYALNSQDIGMTAINAATHGQNGYLIDYHFYTHIPSLIAYFPIPSIPGAALVGTIVLADFLSPFKTAAWAIVLLCVVIGFASYRILNYVSTPIINELKLQAESNKLHAEEMSILNDSLESKVRERTIELEQALILAQEAVKSKMQFLANMSHEIRTPMNGILGMLQALRDANLTQEQLQYARIAYVSAESLLHILDDILNLSKIESGKLDLENVDFNLIETVEDIADLLSSTAHQKNLELFVRMDAQVPKIVKGDPTRLRQILSNLVGNAVKFTNKGEVGISASVVSQQEKDTLIKFTVSDTGIGIPAHAMSKLFQTFSQADNTTTRKFGGTGLGLSISKRLVELMGGEIGVISEEHKGSQFWFTVKLTAVSQQSGLEKFDSTLRNLNVLVVDDNETNRIILENQMQRFNIPCKIADNAAQALEHYSHMERSNKPFNLVISDYMMPGMNGGDLIKSLKNMPTSAQLKTILLSSAAVPFDSTELNAYKIDLVMTKPVRQSILFDNIAMLFGEEIANASSAAARQEKMPEDAENSRCLNILAAEDNEINRKVIKLMLSKLHHEVTLVNNGAEAVAELKTNGRKYDVMLMDCQMPIMDGYEATRAIRAMGSKITIIAMTANSMQGDQEKCFNSGMNAYLVKPLKIDILRKELNKY